MLEGRFICVESTDEHVFKKGKIYKFKYGETIKENGQGTTMRYNNIQHFNSCNSGFCKLEPLKPKQLLESGDKVTYRCNQFKWVLLETGTIHDFSGTKEELLNRYDDNLLFENTSLDFLDIMKIERGTELIWEREEKSAKQIEIESIENEMKKLADRLEQVRKEM